ncbi:MAG: type II secretion system protein [Limisphaerales bacterium]|nr:MAG: type II secretion system protein [Limisphaerales bacterium]
MKLNKQKLGQRGFTLVEVLAVVSIAALLLAMVIGLQSRVQQKAIESRLKTELAAIELALENYKGDKGFYPHSPSDWKDAGNYPSVNWGGSGFPPNNLYKVLVEEQLDQKKAAYLPDIKESEHNGGQLLADGGLGEQVQWNYNSYSPKNNKNTYDLWVEYGDYGDDGEKGTGDDVVKVIGNWGE